ARSGESPRGSRRPDDPTHPDGIRAPGRADASRRRGVEPPPAHPERLDGRRRVALQRPGRPRAQSPPQARRRGWASPDPDDSGLRVRRRVPRPMTAIRAWLSAGVVSVGIVASLGTTGWAQAPMDTEAESKQVKSVIDDTFKTMNARDLDHALAHYADDAQIDSKAAGAK